MKKCKTGLDLIEEINHKLISQGQKTTHENIVHLIEKLSGEDLIHMLDEGLSEGAKSSYEEMSSRISKIQSYTKTLSNQVPYGVKEDIEKLCFGNFD